MKKLIILLLFTLFTLNAQTNTLTNNTSKNSTVKKEEILFIKVGDIASNSVKLRTSLDNLKDFLDKDIEFTDMHASIEPYHKSMSKMLKGNKYKNIIEQNERDLQKMQSEIAIYIRELDKWQSQLQPKVDAYSKSINLLKSYSGLWTRTRKNALVVDAPKAIMKNIKTVINDIKKTNKNIKKRYDNVLTTSQKITTMIVDLKDIDKSLKAAEEEFKNQIFYQNKDTFFDMFSSNKFSYLAYLKSIYSTVIDKYNESKTYFETSIKSVIYLLIIMSFCAVFIWYFNILHKKRTLFVEEDSYHKKEFSFILRPFSSFIILLIMFSVLLFDNRPDSLKELLLYVMIIPYTLIISRIVNKKLNNYIYTFLILFVLFSLNKNSINHELEYRLFLLLINISLLAHFIIVLKYKLINYIEYKVFKYTLYTFIILSIVALSIAIFANMYGSVLLSFSIIKLIFSILYMTVLFYTIHVILRGYIIIFLRRRISTTLFMIEKYSQNIEKTARLLTNIWISLWWLLVIVKLLNIYPYIIEFRDSLLATSWEIGQIVISIQSIVDFLTIAFFTFLTARLTAIILQVEVFARFKFPRGMPTAIITTLNYIIIIVGTILAFSSLGMSAQQFTLIFGALGVGIGFGLRNIIANFVSGIKLVFERPVQIGDTVEINKTFGDVQSIGARSSTIRTYDGSEVVIPNADFMSKDIINWTYSEVDRRKDITFRVDIDNDVDKILNIMKEVALSHKDIICQTDELMPTLNNIGEYYLEFKLYFWLKEDIVRAKSIINVSIYKALVEAGIKMPVQKFNRT